MAYSTGMLGFKSFRTSGDWIQVKKLSDVLLPPQLTLQYPLPQPHRPLVCSCHARLPYHYSLLYSKPYTTKPMHTHKPSTTISSVPKRGGPAQCT